MDVDVVAEARRRTAAGTRDVEVRHGDAHALPLDDKVLGLSRNAERAVRAGHLDRDAADRWIPDMRDGPFLATGLLFTVVARAPAG
jgi:hypothetical protein